MKNMIKMSLLALLIAVVSCKPSTHTFDSVPADAFSEVINQAGVQILDVRTVGEYEEGHITNSINIDVTADGFLEKVNTLLDKHNTVALYCRSGRRSKKAAEQLVNEGYKVVELAGGYNEWKASGRAVAE